MKKILLTTTALSIFAASAAYAEGPTVTLGGTVDFQVGGGAQEDLYDNNRLGNRRKTHSRTEADLLINVDGKSDNGLGYGAQITINADPNTGTEDFGSETNSRNATDAFVYVETAFGRGEMGATDGSNQRLKVNAANFARATGGINGDFHYYTDLTGSQAGGDDFIVTPDLPSVTLPGDVADNGASIREKANKVSYFTPRFQGLQAGVSYTLDQDEAGTSPAFSSGNSGDGTNGDTASFEHIWELGLNYEGQFEQVGIEAAAVYETGDSENVSSTLAADQVDGIEGYELGLALSYAGATVGGSWASLDEIGQTSANNEEANYWTLGAAYEFGPFAASVTYLDSEVENGDGDATNVDKEFTNLVIGADYQLAPGLVPYVEVAFYESDDNTADVANTSGDNEGTIVLVGTELNF